MSYNRKHEDKAKQSKYVNEASRKRGEPYKRNKRDNQDWKNVYEVC